MCASGMLKKQFEAVMGMTMMATACEWSFLMAPVAVHQRHLPPSVARAAGEINGQLAADISYRLVGLPRITVLPKMDAPGWRLTYVHFKPAIYSAALHPPSVILTC